MRSTTIDGEFSVIQALGGLGLFLLGMVIMTEGLRTLAGNAMRTALMRFTRSPYSGALTGAVATAVLQSSSAITVAAVGFVGAGLLSFSASLGVIFGANIGTTVTGWLVVLLGFKFKLGTLALPFVLVGVVMHMFGKGRFAAAGYGLAGFGLIFVGIATMQDGMSGLEQTLRPEDLPMDSVIGRLLLTLLGIVFTLITQSSSAGIAATITAFYAGAINFEQAAALGVGMGIGTTVTAMMAGIGGNAGARRTGVSHLLFNLVVGFAALALIGPYILLWEQVSPGLLSREGGLALVAFHTAYNTLGALVFLPFTRQYAHLLYRLVPDRAPTYTRRLDTTVLDDPTTALTAAQDAIQSELIALLHYTQGILSSGRPDHSISLSDLQSALDETHAYVDQIHQPGSDAADWERLVELIHSLDHLQRLHERCEEEQDRALTVYSTDALDTPRRLLLTSLNETLAKISERHWVMAGECAQQASHDIHELVQPYREQVMAAIARGEIDIADGTGQLEAIRWLRRVSKHIARSCRHFGKAILAAGK